MSHTSANSKRSGDGSLAAALSHAASGVANGTGGAVTELLGRNHGATILEAERSSTSPVSTCVVKPVLVTRSPRGVM